MATEQLGILIDPDITPEAVVENNNVTLTISDLIANMRTHVENLEDEIAAGRTHVENLEDEIAAGRSGEATELWLDTLQADLDLVERKFADFQCAMDELIRLL
jgi:hypothetical protein